MDHRALSLAEIEAALQNLPGWEHRDSWLRKSFTFKTFIEAVQFVNDVAHIADAFNHHPDIYVRYKTVVLILQTHTAGYRVTDWDVALAQRVQRLHDTGKSDAL